MKRVRQQVCGGLLLTLIVLLVRAWPYLSPK